MKPFIIALFIFVFCSISYAQSQVYDPYPRAKIYVNNIQSGQLDQATSDAAILFKNALIDLVRNSPTARVVLANSAPLDDDNSVFTVTQAAPETNVNGYRVELEQLAQGQSSNVYTFAYHIYDHTLYFYDPNSQTWLSENIMPDNELNFRKTVDYGRRFNDQLNNQNGQGTADVSVDLNLPVDVNVSAEIAPPAMPEYEQPECPNDGYLWQPGFWSYSRYRNDYYWVPGAWVAPPNRGVLWTPPYWGYEGARYVFHIGYWGVHIGFYGGINYGYGYGGRGYYGGEWRGDHFAYNTAVVNVNKTVVHNTYINNTVVNNTVINNTVTNNHTSFNGPGGVAAKPTPKEVAVTKEPHFKPTAEQNSNQLQARQNPNQFVKANPGGKPANLATPKVAPFEPKNIGANKVVTPANGGKPNLPQVTNPVKPQVQQTTVTKPVNPQPAVTKPATTVTKPVNPQPAVTKPATTVTKQVNPHPAVTKPSTTVTKQVNPQPTVTKPGNGGNPGKNKRKQKNKPKPVTPPVQ